MKIKNLPPNSSLASPDYSTSLLRLRKWKIPGILTVWLSLPKLRNFQVTYVMLLGVAEEKQNNYTKKPRGIFLFGWLKCSELFKSWKRNNKPHPQWALVWIPPFVYTVFPNPRFQRINENKRAPKKCIGVG